MKTLLLLVVLGGVEIESVSANLMPYSDGRSEFFYVDKWHNGDSVVSICRGTTCTACWADPSIDLTHCILWQPSGDGVIFCEEWLPDDGTTYCSCLDVLPSLPESLIRRLNTCRETMLE